MRTIHKQKLEITDIQEIELPWYSQIIHLDTQDGNVCIWYECDPDQPKEKVTIYCYGTGHKMRTGNQRYIGTAFVFGGLVFHFYQKIGI